MTSGVDLLEDRVARLVPVGLEELVERAGLLTRVDRKYLVPVEDVGTLVGSLPADAQVLQIGARRLFDY